MIKDLIGPDGPLGALATEQAGQTATPVRILLGAVFTACGRASDVLVMRMLAVHSSKRAVSPSHRRVLHIDYATIDLPGPLAWMLR
jgi:hypothetical protein